VKAKRPVSRSVRFDAVLVLACVGVTDGRECPEAAEYRHADPDEAVRLAREDGWTFRSGAARCPRCGCAGASFGWV
jgi:hypothetical protein